MNPKLNTKISILSRLGSFWVSQSSKDSQYGLPLIRSVSRMVDHGNFDLRIFEASDILSVNSVWSYNVDYRFDHNDVTVIRSDVSSFYLNTSNRLIRYDTGGVITETYDWSASTVPPHFVIRVPLWFKPTVIFAKGTVLVAGMAYETGDGFIRFFVSPHEIFTDNLIQCKLNNPRVLNLFDYTVQVDAVYSKLPQVTSYLRDNHSIVSFEKAINEVLGRVTLQDNVIVSEIIHIEKSETYVYVFDNDTHVRVDYPHTPLVLGNFYEAGTIIGKCAFLNQAPTIEERIRSWIIEHLPEGLHLHDVNPNNLDIRIPNRKVKFWAFDTGTSDLNVRAQLEGSEEDLDAYAHMSKTYEDKTNRYLNSIFQFEDEGDFVRRNAIDFYIEHVFLGKLVIAKLDSNVLTSLQINRAKRFIRDNAPCGVIVVISVAESTFVDGSLMLDQTGMTLGLDDGSSYLVLK